MSIYKEYYYKNREKVLQKAREKYYVKKHDEGLFSLRLEKIERELKSFNKNLTQLIKVMITRKYNKNVN